MNGPRGYHPGLVDLASGLISREIFVNEDIYAQEQERDFRPVMAVRRPRKPDSQSRAISSSRAWARNR